MIQILSNLGAEWQFQAPTHYTYAVPEELQARLDAAPELRAAFEALTPGRRKSYIFHVSGAK